MPVESPGELILAEPAGRCVTRPPLVADCSVLAAVLFDEPERDRAVAALAGHELYAPDLLDHELANVAVKKSGAISEEVIVRALSDLTQLRIARRRIDVIQQWRLALRFDLSAYDAAYLVLATELNAPLVTFDRRLGEAARQALG